MKITTRKSNGIQIVDIEGKLDSKGAGYGNEEMTRIVKENNRVIINLENLEFITSAGLRVLVVASKLQQTSGGMLKMCNANYMVKGVLETCGFNHLIELYSSEDEAIRSFIGL